jgi:cytochrome c oxidase assembly factor CtaG
MPNMDRERAKRRRGATRRFRRAAWPSDRIASLMVGVAIWGWMALTSREVEAWNDNRYWPSMLLGGFVLGLIFHHAAKSNGVLLSAGGSLAALVESIVRIGVRLCSRPF